MALTTYHGALINTVETSDRGYRMTAITRSRDYDKHNAIRDTLYYFTGKGIILPLPCRAYHKVSKIVVIGWYRLLVY